MSTLEAQTAQIRLNKNVIVPEGAGGSIIWVTPSRARMLIDAKAAEPFGKIQEQPAIGPTETKPIEASEKKFSAADQDGHLTDSAPSNESGKAAPSSASAAAPASQKPKSKPSKKRTTKAKSR